MVLLSIAKGLLMMIVIVALANTGFIESLALAVCSATITGVFLVISTVLGSKKTSENVKDLKAKVEIQTEETKG